jgi:pyruvyltransferase
MLSNRKPKSIQMNTTFIKAVFIALLFNLNLCAELPLYYYREPELQNFGDYVSLKIVERMVNGFVRTYQKNRAEQKILGLGSILYFAAENDVVWGSGINGKRLDKKDYSFKNLDVRAVRGPLTRQYLMENFQIEVPEVYGDPALLFPYLFPEYKKKKNPSIDTLIIVHYKDTHHFPRNKEDHHIVYATDPWDQIILKIIDSKFVVATSMHGVIIAEAYGIPARYLRVSEIEPWFKFVDYYYGTNRPYFQYATSLEEALEMGGEQPYNCDIEKLYNAFPFEFWPNYPIQKPDLTRIP